MGDMMHLTGTYGQKRDKNKRKKQYYVINKNNCARFLFIHLLTF